MGAVRGIPALGQQHERFMKRIAQYGMMGLVAGLMVGVAEAELGDASTLPPAAKKRIVFEKDIKPLFEKSCIDCHGPDKQKGKFRLDTREDALKGGSSDEAAIIPGNSAKSPLVHYAAYLVEDMEMPPASKKYEDKKLTAEQVGLLRAWIDQGARF